MEASKGGGPNLEKVAPMVGAPMVGAPKVGAPKVGPEGWGLEGWALKGGGPKCRAFFLSRHNFLSFFSLGVFSWNFGGV